MLYAIWTANIASKMMIAVANSDCDRSIAATDIAHRISCLETALSPVESSFDRIEKWLFGFTVLVVVGLVVEYWDDIREFRTALWERRRGLSLPSHSTPVWKLARAVTGGLLVTIGVAGELVEEFNGAQVEVRMRGLNGRIDSLLELEAGNARKEAASATKSAAALGVKVDTLPSFVAKKEGEITGQISAFQKVANAEQKLAQTNVATMQALHNQDQTLRDKITLILTPRDLTVAQQNTISSSLKQFKGTPFDVGVSIDADSTNLMAKIGHALLDAGWAWKPSSSGRIALTPLEGQPSRIIIRHGIAVNFAQSQSAKFEAAVSTLVGDLRTDGFREAIGNVVPDTIGGKPNPNAVPPDAIHIEIGEKVLTQ